MVYSIPSPVLLWEEPRRKFLEGKVREFEIEGKVLFHGMVDNVYAHMNCMDIVLIYTGENYADIEEINRLKSQRHRFDDENASYIIHKYEVPVVIYATAGLIDTNRHFWFKDKALCHKETLHLKISQNVKRPLQRGKQGGINAATTLIFKLLSRVNSKIFATKTLSL